MDYPPYLRGGDVNPDLNLLEKSKTRSVQKLGLLIVVEGIWVDKCNPDIAY